MPWTEIRGPGGSSLPTVRPVSAVGAVYSCWLQAAAVGAAATGATQILDAGATGWKRVVIWILTASSAGHAVLAGWSTTTGDTACEANLHAACLAHAAGTPTQFPNVMGTAAIAVPIIIEWDGVTTIKRVCCERTEATAVSMRVEVVA